MERNRNFGQLFSRTYLTPAAKALVILLTNAEIQWLDEGDGKTLDLKQCPRARLEKERIIYLNAQQRMNYKVVVDQGLLVWARNKEPLNTTKAHRDAGPDVGIVAMTEEEVKEKEEKEKAEKKARAKNGGETPPDSSSDEETEEGVGGYSDKVHVPFLGFLYLSGEQSSYHSRYIGRNGRCRQGAQTSQSAIGLLSLSASRHGSTSQGYHRQQHVRESCTRCFYITHPARLQKMAVRRRYESAPPPYSVSCPEI